MLKKIAYSGLLLSMLTLPLLAQETTAPATDATGNNRTQRYQAADPATRAQRQTDRMAKMLSLDQATTKKVYDLNLARAQKAEDIMKGSDSGKGKALQANTDEYETKLQAVLTPDQMAKVKQMQAETQDRMRNRQGNNPNNN